jgi:hypothetical protein
MIHHQLTEARPAAPAGGFRVPANEEAILMALARLAFEGVTSAPLPSVPAAELNHLAGACGQPMSPRTEALFGQWRERILDSADDALAATRLERALIWAADGLDMSDEEADRLGLKLELESLTPAEQRVMRTALDSGCDEIVARRLAIPTADVQRRRAEILAHLAPCDVAERPRRVLTEAI